MSNKSDLYTLGVAATGEDIDPSSLEQYVIPEGITLVWTAECSESEKHKERGETFDVQVTAKFGGCTLLQLMEYAKKPCWISRQRTIRNALTKGHANQQDFKEVEIDVSTMHRRAPAIKREPTAADVEAFVASGKIDVEKLRAILEQIEAAETETETE